MAEDYYDILGVDRSASSSDIQKAYRSLARKHHPDLAEDQESAKEKFQQIQQAYDVLSDPEKRKMFDQFGSSYDQMGGQNPFQGGQGQNPFGDIDISQLFGQAGGGGNAGGGGFENIFRQFGGGGGAPGGGAPGGRGRRRAPVPGKNIQHELTVPLNTAITGGEAHVNLRRPGGQTESIRVKIPTGIQDGQKIRLKGQGDPSPSGGETGDLLIKVLVAKHPYFERVGNNLYVTVPVSVVEAALGAKIDVPTPEGTVTVTVPPASSSGEKLRLRGMGVKNGSGADGDVVVELKIVLPEKLDKASNELIEKLGRLNEDHSPRTDLRW